MFYRSVTAAWTVRMRVLIVYFVVAHFSASDYERLARTV